ncbi:MAG TPA: chemotaxis protein CheW [Desulfuromonadales bacterium]|nr:chemotaxis protein CheW [Desulfuromonadales bacterium]
MGQVLLFRLGEDSFALEVTALQEVVDHPALHYLPQAPEHFLGAINVHGQVLPLLDLSGFLGYPQRPRHTRYIVLAPEVCAVALAVDNVGRIVTPDEPEGEEDQSTQTGPRSEEIMCGGVQVRLLDAGQLHARLEQMFQVTGGQDGV